MRKSISSFRFAAGIACSAGLSFGAFAGGPDALTPETTEPALFGLAATQHQLPAGIEARRHRTVNLTAGDLLTNPLENEQITLNLFEDLTFTAVRRDVFATAKADFNWIGGLAEDEHAVATFARVEDSLYGIIDSPAFGQFVVQQASPNGEYLVIEIDQDGLSPCGVQPEHNLWWDDAAVGPEQGQPLLPEWHFAEQPAPQDDLVSPRGSELTEVDVLILYTQNALNGVGGNPNTMAAALQAWENNTNNAYNNSGVMQRIRVVHIELTSYAESSTNMGTDLSRLRSNGEGFMDDVHLLRSQYGADLVHLVTRQAVGGTCGIAYLLFPGANSNVGFGVTAYNCGWQTFAHELGHNMGCAHDRNNASSGYRCDSFGYRTPNNQYRTIMSYAPGSRISYFSNPDVTFAGFPLGISEAAGCANATAADNTNSMNITRAVVSNFRPTVVGNPPPVEFGVIQPMNGDVGQQLSGYSLQWEDSEFAISYEFTLDDDSDMSSPLVETTVTSNGWAVTPGLLEFNTTYYWSVRAVNFGGETVMDPQVASFTTRLEADVNASGAVDFADFNLVLSQFGQSGGGLIGDVNQDGAVNFIDLNLVLGAFGQSQ